MWVVGIALFVVAWWMSLIIWPDYGEPFTYDQARDLLETRELVQGRDIKLLGPTTSINGVHLGPVYYYLLLPGIWVGGGDPQSVLDWQVSLFFISCIGLFIWAMRNKDWAVILTALVIGTMPVTTRSSHYFWNAHFMLTSMIWLIWIWKLASKNQKTWLWIGVGMVSGVCLQMESALGIVVFPAIIIRLWMKKWKSTIRWVIVGFGITLIPQIVYELTHGMQMSKLLLHEINGQGVLGDQINNWSDLIQDRWRMLVSVFISSFSLPPAWSLGVFVSLLWLGWWGRKKGKGKSEIGVPGLIWVLAIALYLVYPYQLKHWYTYGLCVILMWGFWEWVVGSGYKKSVVVGVGIALILFANGLIEADKFKQSAEAISLENPSSLVNQIEVIKAADSFCGDDDYAIHTLVPGIYDYSYQYLVWWMGKEGQIRLPSVMSYEPGVPAYVPNYDSLSWSNSSDETKNVCVIIEPGTENLQPGWEGRIGLGCVSEEKVFNFGTRVEKRVSCETENEV